MKKNVKRIITQKKFNSIPRNEYGIRNCPSNCDYTQITSFGDQNIFGVKSKFGDFGVFGNHNNFGSDSIFGNNNMFGEQNRFGNRIQFGDDNLFGYGNTFESCNSFGNINNFGSGNSFDIWNTFGYENVFRNGTMSGIKFTSIFQLQNVDGSKRQIHFLITDNKKIMIVAGCFVGTLDEFIKRANDENKLKYVKVFECFKKLKIKSTRHGNFIL